MSKVKTFITQHTIIPIFVGFLLIAATIAPKFLTVNNIFNIFNQNAMKGIMAIGMTFVIINGYFDISLVTLVGLTAAIAAKIQAIHGLFPAITAALLVGMRVGAINGLLISRADINAFVVTLGVMLGCRGVAYIYHGGSSITVTSQAFKDFGTGKIGPISYISIVYIVLLLIAHYVLKYTKHGRNTYAVGGNQSAAFNAGINTRNVTLINFIICGLMGAIGAVLYVAYLGASTPTLGWPDLHMLVISAIVLGGTKLSGGVGSVWYSLGGIMILGIIENSMNLLNVQTYVNTMVTGIIIILVLCMDKVIYNR